ncbi:UDP-glycosyltransferase 73E1-like [Juglans microcarpa x Juglans regia]|uniref:UDP-glycosyltransferase 73E1-like n=1 Tax=Juglans microcarpa x Juglans regia TaxID=2249226 RepID=UPI001B7E790C|nr:UDP-glycosyltransferase 73E1-like [Juglans microcarpa x Juglans regia]
MAPQYSGADHQLHFVMIPLMCPGHIIPMADMARLLAQRGVIITIITTTLNVIRIKPIIGHAIESGLPIRIVQLRLQLHEVGLPEGCESIDTIPSRSLFGNFFAAVNKLQQPLEELLEDMEPTPSCILADKNLPWIADVAGKFNIPRLLFDGTGCFNLLCCHSLHASQVHVNASDSEFFVVPGLPERIELTKAQLPSGLNPSMQDFKDLHAKIRASEEGAYGIVINSFEELESAYVKEYRKAKGDNKVWCIGPVSLSNKTDLEKAQRGTLCRLTPLQLIELGLGLEACNRPFLWVIRGDNGKEELEKWILEDGFEERTNRRGLLIRGWAPQVLILSHPAIGGFLTHCGWNSTLEAICAGVPMVTWPLFADQFFNEKLVVQVLKIGERVGNEIAVPVGEDAKSGVLVKRKKVRETIQKIMTEGKEGEERRERVRKLAEMAREATEKGGSSFLNITSLIEDIRKLGMGIQA